MPERGSPMFYVFEPEVKEVQAFRAGRLTAGYVRSEELQEMYRGLGFAESTAAACQSANLYFRSGVEVYDDYTFTELRIVDRRDPEAEDDCVALFIRKDLFLVVDVLDADRSTEGKFLSALRRFPAQSMTLEKLTFAFLESLLAGDISILESTGAQIADLEETVLRGEAEKDFSFSLLALKNRLMSAHNYYEQLLDITEAVEENENELFDSESLRYISNLSKKILRLREDVDSLSSAVVHLQDAYSAQLDIRMNQTMKLFTVITSIFFPLTIIVGWYGMNFQYMPEFTWRYGYLYVILLSVAVVLTFVLLGKKKKWF